MSTTFHKLKMDSSSKKIDISKRILETRKQTEQLKSQLQNLIDSGIASSIDHKSPNQTHLDKENVVELKNKVQIIKSYDKAHSQHVTKPSSSKINIPANKNDIKIDVYKSPKKVRHYDVNQAREYIRKQKEKRLEQQKLENEEKRKAELQKQKLQELHKKSLELVTKNVQAKRERSKSRDGDKTDFVRPIKDIPRSRSASRDRRDIENNNKLTEKFSGHYKGVDLEPVDSNFLYPPSIKYVHSQGHYVKVDGKSPKSSNKIVIISGNSSDKKDESPKSNFKSSSKSLQPKNLFNTKKTNATNQEKHSNISTQLNKSIVDEEEINELNKTLPKDLTNLKTISASCTEKLAELKKCDTVVNEPKHLQTMNVELPQDLSIKGKSSIELPKTIVSNILEYRNTHHKSNADINLNTSNYNTLKKFEIAVGTDNLEKSTKETQTNSEPKQALPLWLQEKRFDSNPLNFINTVRRKLQNAVDSPKMHVDVGIQGSIQQQIDSVKSKDFLQLSTKFDKKSNQNSNPASLAVKSNKEIEILPRSTKSSKACNENSNSYISRQFFNLDKQAMENVVIPKKISERSFTTVKKTLETESESDTSKNIPEISSESGTSLKKNAESVKQNGNAGLDTDRLDSMKLKTHNINKNTQSIHTEQPTQYSLTADTKQERIKSDVKRSESLTPEQYTSEFQSRSRSITTDTNVNSSNYQLLTDPKVTLYSEKPSSIIPESLEKRSKNIPTENSSVIEIQHNSIGTSKNITVRTNTFTINTSQNENSFKENTKSASGGSKSKHNSSDIPTESETERSNSKSQKSKHMSTKYNSLYTDFHPSPTKDVLSKSDSSLQNINTTRGESLQSKPLDIPPLKQPTVSLGTISTKVEEKDAKVVKNVLLRPDASKPADLNTNEVHLRFEAEIHLLNDFNESLRQFSEVEKAFDTLKKKSDTPSTTNKIFQDRDTQTSIATKSSTPTGVMEKSISDRSQLSSINYSRGFGIEADSSSLNIDHTVSRLNNSSNAGNISREDVLRLNIENSFSNFENLQSHNFAGMTLRMFEQLIKDEDVRLENLKTILKIREQALLDRTKGELAWLEIQRKHLRETGKLHEASLIKKKQRGILVNHQKEKHEMQRLKQMQKAASLERKIILKEQRNLIKHQLSTDNMLSKIKVNAPRERRLSGPLKVIQSHTESIKSETSLSRRSSSDREKEVYSIMSHTQSIISRVSEVSGDEVMLKNAASGVDSVDLPNKFTAEAPGVPISHMKRTLLIREAALQKRRKAAEELLQWHRKLLEEEKRIKELESTANAIISQIPNSAPASTDEKYQFKGKQLNQLWLNLTGCTEKKFNDNKIYPMSQITLERFCKSAREYSTKTKKILRRVSDSEVSELSIARTDESISENIPEQKIVQSASVRTESIPSQQNSHRNKSISATSTNEYASDFDVESIDEMVNVEDMDVVDKSINQLIDNFSKIQDDISLLGIIQSQKSGINLELEESIRSEKTDTDLEVSVIETAKTSKRQTRPEQNSSCSRNVSTLQDIDDFPNNVSKSEVYKTEVIQLPHSVSVEEDVTSYQATDNEIPSIVEAASVCIEEKNNLNKSQEILEELSNLEKHIIIDVAPNKDTTVEELEICEKGKDNLSRSEDILSRLTQQEDKSSIIIATDTPSKDLLQDEIKSLNNTSEPGISLELQPIQEKSKEDISDSQIPQKETNSISSVTTKSKTTPSISKKSPPENVSLNKEIIDLSSEIISERSLGMGGSVEAKDIVIKTSYEPVSSHTVDEISDISNKLSSVIADNLIVPDEDIVQVHDYNDNSLIRKEIDCEIQTDIPQSEHNSEEGLTLPHHEQTDLASVLSEKEKLYPAKTEEVLEEMVKAQYIIEEFTETGKKSDSDSQEILNEPNSQVANEDSKAEITIEDCEIITQGSNDKLSNALSSKQSLLEMKLNENNSQNTISDAESVDKSEVANLLINKEDINSYEEKELDSLSSSTTCSQSDMINEKEISHISDKSKSSTSPRSCTVDVKKRVSEIMADASQVSRGDKSPKLQDFYTTTYDLTSPTNSPELGSPTEDNKFIAAKSIFGTEAEELLRKQLAIEQEIKLITEQQQKEQVPYLFVREIPNKPPPPYTPPSSTPPTNVLTIVPSTEEIEDITKYSARILHKAYLSNNLDNISISENTLSLISKNISKTCYKFVFDLCKEISKEHYKQFEKEKCPVWLQVKKNPRLTVVKPLDVNGLEKHMNSKLKELFGYEKPVRRENAIIKWSRKKRDHVDEVLVMESQAEETQWTNYGKDELLVMNEVTNEIINMLLKETGDVFRNILSKHTS